MSEEILIDTSLILEPFGPHRKNGENYKEKALTILRYDNIGFARCTSMSILGELNFILNKKENILKIASGQNSQTGKMKELIDEYVGNCKLLPISKEAISLANTILIEDDRLDPLDVLHFSTAVCEKCSGFMFMDEKMQNSKVLKDIAKENNLKLMPFNTQENRDKGKNKGFICLQEFH